MLKQEEDVREGAAFCLTFLLSTFPQEVSKTLFSLNMGLHLHKHIIYKPSWFFSEIIKRSEEFI